MTPLSHCSSRHSSSSLPASTLLPPFRASESVNPNVVMEVFTRRQQQTSERNYRLISTSLAHEIQGPDSGAKNFGLENGLSNGFNLSRNLKPFSKPFSKPKLFAPESGP